MAEGRSRRYRTHPLHRQLQVSQAGQTFIVTVTEVTPESVVPDASHPLASEDLRFELELVEIV